MNEVSIEFIKARLNEEENYVKKMKSVYDEMTRYGHYKSCNNEMERFYWEFVSMPQYVQYPYGVVAVQESTDYFYRGEPKIYPDSKPSLIRALPFDAKERALFLFVEGLRLSELAIFFRKLYAINCWGKGEFNFSAVAQHYGFKTNLMDITNRLRIALFFACCTTDDGGVWRPLDNRDFKEQAECSINGKYGVLFVGNKTKMGTSLVHPIGYQPLLRCHMQYGYVLPMDLQWDLKDEELAFKHYCFKHTEKFCEEIFNMNCGGKLIYPNDTDKIFLPFLNKIRKTTSFSKKVFNIVVKHKSRIPFLLDYKFNETDIINNLKSKGISISETDIISCEEIEKINNEWCTTCHNSACDNTNRHNK